MPKSKAANTAGCGVSTAALEPVELLQGVVASTGYSNHIVTRDVLGTKKTPSERRRWLGRQRFESAAAKMRMKAVTITTNAETRRLDLDAKICASRRSKGVSCGRMASAGRVT